MVKEMDKGIKIAYLILAHTAPIQLANVAKRLSNTGDVYVHINRRVKLRPFVEAVSHINADNIFFVAKRYNVHWGGMSIVRATMEMLDNAVGRQHYDRFILLTGLDYPIMTDSEMLNFWASNREIDYIHADKVTGDDLAHLKHVHYRDSRVTSILGDFLIRRFPNAKMLKKDDYVVVGRKNYVLYGIAPKWCLTGESGEYLLDFYKHQKKYNKYFTFSHAPDDFYVATVILNSGMHEVNVDRDMFYMHWIPGDNGATTKVFKLSDWQELKESGCMFAKRFLSDESNELIKKLNGSEI